MAHNKFSVKVSQTPLDGQRLDQVLKMSLEIQHGLTLSRNAIRNAIAQGAVYVNRKRVHIASRPIIVGTEIEIFLQNPVATPALASTLYVLYEDEDLIFINKPAGIPCVPTVDQSRACLSQWVKQHLQKNNSHSYLGIHHRLDLDTSGVILFTKNTAANKPIADLFMHRKIQKSYQMLAHTHNCPYVNKKSFSITTHHGVVGKLQKKKKYGSLHAGGDLAITNFEWIHQERTVSWLKAQPVTGRTHQIRVHASESGFSILGDTFYGGANSLYQAGQKHALTRPYLHAASLELEHPSTQKKIIIHAPIPQEFHNCWKFIMENKL